MSATKGGRGREVWKMLTIADKGEVGIRQMLKIAEKGGEWVNVNAGHH